MNSNQADRSAKASFAPTIFLLSGGIGASAEQLVQTVLAQFPDNNLQIQIVGNVRQAGQITLALQQAKAVNGLVVFTLVDTRLSRQLLSEAQQMGVETMDLMGPLIDWIGAALGKEPLQEPGKYRQAHRVHLERIIAIEYTLSHDDGKNPEGWPQAELVLVGVSRVGKTPLSIFLAVLGWKVANVPLVPELPVPPALFDLDPRRVIGLTVDPEQLLVYRRQRQMRLGVSQTSDYTDLESIQQEIQHSRQVFRRGNFHIINMSDKTIEQGADEIIRKLSDQANAMT